MPNLEEFPQIANFSTTNSHKNHLTLFGNKKGTKETFVPSKFNAEACRDLVVPRGTTATAATTTTAATVTVTAATEATTVAAATAAATTAAEAAATAAATTATETTAAAATTAAEAAAATTTAAAARFTGTSNVDCQGAILELVVVEHFNRFLRFRITRHFHKAKTLGTASLTILNHHHRSYRASAPEQFLQIVLCCIIGQIANIKFGFHFFLFSDSNLSRAGSINGGEETISSTAFQYLACANT